MLQVSTFIAASAVEGVGVFAAVPIAKGQSIWKFDPRFDLLFPFSDYHSAQPWLKELLDRYAYPSPDRPGFLVYEADNGRFMNHSESPNTDFSGMDGKARHDIAAGEELTCNYAEFYPDFRAGLGVG